jgi:MFS family permease
MVYISRWFDRRRGSALALVTSGQYLAGALWPALIRTGIQSFGWRSTMLAIGAITTSAILPVAVFALVRPPKGHVEAADWISIQKHTSISGIPRALVFALLCLAGFLCCVPMAMPSAHLVALCGDVGAAVDERGHDVRLTWLFATTLELTEPMLAWVLVVRTVRVQ